MKPGICLICCLFGKFYNYILWRIYRFDWWHASAPWSCRPYKKQVVELAKHAGASTVMEIGCGLGEIICRIPAERRFGFDADPAVIKAGSRIASRSVNFHVASLSEIDKLQKICSYPVDLLVMVNWLHNIKSSEIIEAVTLIGERIGLRYLLVDEIKKGFNGYRYNHDSDFLSSLGRITKTIDAIDGVRRLHLIEISCNE